MPCLLTCRLFWKREGVVAVHEMFLSHHGAGVVRHRSMANGQVHDDGQEVPQTGTVHPLTVVLIPVVEIIFCGLPRNDFAGPVSFLVPVPIIPVLYNTVLKKNS